VPDKHIDAPTSEIQYPCGLCQKSKGQPRQKPLSIALMNNRTYKGNRKTSGDQNNDTEASPTVSNGYGKRAGGKTKDSKEDGERGLEQSVGRSGGGGGNVKTDAQGN